MSVRCDSPTDQAAPAALTLRISAAGHTPRRVVVASELLLGRDVDGEGRLEHPGVSRQHARISRDAVGRFVLDDIGSTNGTFLNGSLVCERLSLTVGDTIRLGAAEKIYVEADSQAGVDLASAPPAGGRRTGSCAAGRRRRAGSCVARPRLGAAQRSRHAALRRSGVAAAPRCGDGRARRGEHDLHRQRACVFAPCAV